MAHKELSDKNNNNNSSSNESFADGILNITKEVTKNLEYIDSERLYLSKPLEYVDNSYAQYVKKYCQNKKNVLFLAMNPGPLGMCKIPFGERNTVKEWFEIDWDDIRQDTPSEVGGKRFWGLFKEICEQPENFFRDAFVYNYCPIGLSDSEKINVKFASLSGGQKEKLEKYCDDALIKLLKQLKPTIVVGIGLYAEKRAKVVLKDFKRDIEVYYLRHPKVIGDSNYKWERVAKKFLHEKNLMDCFVPKNVSTTD